MTWRYGASSRQPIRLAILGCAILGAYLSLQASLLPFAWFWLAWFVALLWFGLTAGTAFSKAIWINVSAALLALALGEIYLWSSKIEKTNAYCCDDLYFIRDDDLGIVPRKNFAATHQKIVNSVPIYKVTYTIDANGLRIAPPYDVAHGRGSILFFGCSYTMGDGVEDNETMPYLTGLLTQGRYAVYNFGFHGYGPQQMLAALETGRVQRIVTVSPRYIIYQAIPYHMERVAGLMTWFPHVPLYRRTDSGRVVPDGHVDSVADETRYSPIERFWRRQGPTGEAISKTLRRSYIYDKFVRPLRSLSDEDVRLFLDVVLQAKEEAARQYPQSEFHVILWDNMFVKHDFLQFLPRVLETLRNKHVRVHLVSEIIPDYYESTPNTKYEIDRYDNHPNPSTYRAIAAYVAKNILHEE
ncbi:MAG TPA: hypothetical protein VFG71_00195 [Nitrospiraceae bacterium]|nr:hypothetical protein [Nitrospiraceae bacterium]